MTNPRTERGEALKTAQKIYLSSGGHSNAERDLADALLATNEELERLRAENEKWRITADKFSHWNDSAQAEYRRLREAAQSVVDSWYQNHAGNDANGAGHVGNSALESLAAALSEAPATEGSAGNG